MTTNGRLYVSRRGLRDLEVQLEKRHAELRAICDERDQAFELSGDGWHDNPYFNKLQLEEANKTKQIAELQNQIRTAVLFDPPARRDTRRVALGAVVRVSIEWHDEGVEEVVVWEIVPFGETNAERGRLAYNIPLVRPIMGLEAGESVTTTTPRGKATFEVIELLPRPVVRDDAAVSHR